MALVAGAPKDAEAQLADELKSRSEDELRGMAERLQRSFNTMEEFLEETKAENTQLTEDNQGLNETIKLMMQETRKLNISSSNTQEPELHEDPLNFVSRFWERVKPRDNQVLISDNIGELKEKPNPDAPLLAVPAELRHNIRNLKEQVGAEELQASAQQRLEELRASSTELHANLQATVDGNLQAAGERLASTQEYISGAMQNPETLKTSLRETQEALVAETARHGAVIQQRTTELQSTAEEQLNSARQVLRQKTSDFQEKTSELMQKPVDEHLNSAREVLAQKTSDLKEKTSELMQKPVDEHLTEAAAAVEAVSGSIWKRASENWVAFSGLAGLTQDAAGYTQSEEDSDPERTAREAASAMGREYPMNVDRPEGAGSVGADGLEREAEETPKAPAEATSAPAPAEGVATATLDSGAESPPAEGSPDRAESPPAESPADDSAEEAIIIAEITLDDGSMQTIRMGARDRCKDVVHRFVQEHSLKQWFEEPLRKFLKKVESEAEKFPVVVNGDLLEIRNDFK